EAGDPAERAQVSVGPDDHVPDDGAPVRAAARRAEARERYRLDGIVVVVDGEGRRLLGRRGALRGGAAAQLALAGELGAAARGQRDEEESPSGVLHETSPTVGLHRARALSGFERAPRHLQRHMPARRCALSEHPCACDEVAGGPRVAGEVLMAADNPWLVAALLVAAPILLIVLYDVVQRKNPILRNFPFVGHFRFLLIRIGPELRQYIVASNREEAPFNRSEREWIYRSAERENNYFGFGTDDQPYGIGYPIIKHACFPIGDEAFTGSKHDKVARIPCAKVIGEAHRRARPYRPDSIINISAMSFGSLGRNAISALNKGAKLADCFHNTGEGG